MQYRRLFRFLCRGCFTGKITGIQHLCILYRPLRRFLSLWRALRNFFLFCLKHIDETHRTAALAGRLHLFIKLFSVKTACRCPRGFDIRYNFLLWLIDHIAPVKSNSLFEWCLIWLIGLHCLSFGDKTCVSRL